MPTLTAPETPVPSKPHPMPKTPIAPLAIPNLTWISGKITQILLQDKENFYVVGVSHGATTSFARFGDPYTGKSGELSADDPMYALIEKAYFKGQYVELGVRDFGYDSQAGIDRIIIDRVTVHHP